MKKKKIIIGLIVVAVFLVGVFAWSTWRKSVTANQSEQTQTEVTDSQTEQQPVSKEENEKLAKEFELALRNWGVDPTIDPATLAKKDASEVLTALRTPELDDSPVKSMISFTPDSNVSPNAMSTYCTLGYQGLCADALTKQAEGRNEFWGIGSRWIGAPNVKADDDGTVTIKGTVKTILVTNGDTFKMGGYYAITPAWGEYEVNDKLTVKDGKIVSISYYAGNWWWTNPWLSEWNLSDAVTQLGYGKRIVIPVKGSLSWDGLAPTGMFGLLYAPVTQADDTRGACDWSLWNDIHSRAGGEGLQQLPEYDPDEDAATIEERE